MRIRIWPPAVGILPLCLLSAMSLPGSMSAQLMPGCGIGRGRGGLDCGAPDSGVDPAEQAAYDAFKKEALVDTKIVLGEQKYPKSRFQEEVNADLTFLVA